MSKQEVLEGLSVNELSKKELEKIIGDQRILGFKKLKDKLDKK